MKGFLLVIVLAGCAAAQTTLFGWTLGRPAIGDGRVGLGENAVLVGHHTIDGDVSDEGDDVEEIFAYYKLVMCQRVETALREKFGPPTIRTPWHGRSGIGLPVAGNRYIWKRKNGDWIVFDDPNQSDLSECMVRAVSDKLRKHPQEKPTL